MSKHLLPNRPGLSVVCDHNMLEYETKTFRVSHKVLDSVSEMFTLCTAMSRTGCGGKLQEDKVSLLNRSIGNRELVYTTALKGTCTPKAMIES